MKKKLLLSLIPFLLLSLSACQRKASNNSNVESISEQESISGSEVDESSESHEGYEPQEPSESEPQSETSSESEETESISEESQDSETPYAPSTEKGLEGDPIRTDPVAQEYYKNIPATLSGSELGNALSSLVNKNRCTTGYGALWGYYPYCDADPDNPTSDKIIAFYRGTPATQGQMNKEHVWPNSHGGNLVEGDPHMTRPTLNSDNSSRGNSFYVEGMAHTADGWDPKADGMNENYRGDSARIIFYAAIVKYGTLKLVDKTKGSSGDYSMGKLSDLIKWNYEYPVSKYEILRNEVLSGERSVKGSNYTFNRNPFIDDRTLPCKLWGDTNEETKRLCAMYVKQTHPTSLTLNESELSLSIDGEFQLEVSAATPADAVRTVNWSSSDTSIVSVDKTGLVKAINDGEAIVTATSTLDSKIKATCHIVVDTEETPLEGITVTSSMTITKGSNSQINVGYTPLNVYPRPTLSFASDNENAATVSSTGLVTGVNKGSAKITITATQGNIKKYGYCQVTVNEITSFNKITAVQSNWAGKYLIVSENDNVVFNSGASSIDSSENAKGVNISNNTIAANNDTLKALVEVEQVGSEYRLKTSDGKYLTSSDKKILNTGDESSRVKFVMASDGSVNITLATTKTMQYNPGFGFRMYDANKYNKIYLYKL